MLLKLFSTAFLFAASLRYIYAASKKYYVQYTDHNSGKCMELTMEERDNGVYKVEVSWKGSENTPPHTIYIKKASEGDYTDVKENGDPDKGREIVFKPMGSIIKFTLTTLGKLKAIFCVTNQRVATQEEKDDLKKYCDVTNIMEYVDG